MAGRFGTNPGGGTGSPPAFNPFTALTPPPQAFTPEALQRVADRINKGPSDPSDPRVVTSFASPEQKAAHETYLKGMPGTISGAIDKGTIGRTQAIETLGKAWATPTEISASGMPQAQTSGFNISGAPQYSQVTSTGGGIPVTQAQQQLNATMGNLGQYVAGAGAGTSQATIQQSAAMDEQQKIAMANALGQIKEQGFAGGATAGGMGNLSAMAAAQSAGDFARQKAGLLESERNAALSAMGQQGNLAGTLGNLGLGVSAQQLQADTANQDAAIRAGALAQSGDIAGAELALKGTGMNMDQAMQIARSNQDTTLKAQIANQGNAANLAKIQAETPEMQALRDQLAFGSQLAPYQAAPGVDHPPEKKTWTEKYVMPILTAAAGGASSATATKYA